MIDPAELAAEILGLVSRPIRSAEQERLRDLRVQLCAVFAAEHGWVSARRDFTLEALINGRVWAPYELLRESLLFDHPFYFRCARKRAAAIAAHLYDWDSREREARAFAAKKGLAIEAPQFPSWWFPGRTTLVLWVGPAGMSPQARSP